MITLIHVNLIYYFVLNKYLLLFIDLQMLTFQMDSQPIFGNIKVSFYYNCNKETESLKT